MVDKHYADEFLLIGKLMDKSTGEQLTHASTFIRLERTNGSKVVLVVVHLDCNFPNPQCTSPALLGVDSDVLSFKKQFGNYHEISLF